MGIYVLSDWDMEATGTSSYGSTDCDLSKDTTAPLYKGTQHLRLTSTGNTFYAYQSCLTAGVKYRVTGAARSDGTAIPYVAISGLQAWTGTASTSWQTFDVEIVPSNSLFLLGSNSNHPGVVDFDHVRVYETDLYNTVKSRILGQFQSATRIQAFLKDTYDELENFSNLLINLRDSRDVDSAEGVWLDAIGDIVGCERGHLQQDYDTIFTFKSLGEADDADMGFYDSGPPATGGYFQEYEGLQSIASPEDMETDTDYRKRIKAKAIANVASGTVKDVYSFIYDGFGAGCTVTSVQTGEVLLTLSSGQLSQWARRWIEETAPLHAGVRIEFTNWEI